MSGLWSGSQTSSNNGSTGPGRERGDPVRQLDPKLRDFLDKESPAKYNPLATSDAAESVPYREQVPLAPTTSKWSETGVPPQSLYQDGRYSDLWKTYKPQEEIEAATKTDQDRLHDIVAGLKARKTQISRAALENCSFEQTIVSDCFKFGGWYSRMTMCNAENKAFARCYTTQGKFLKALGYLSNYDRPKEVDEQIQMHADKLYHRMLAQEKVIEQARAEGKPVPSLEDLLPEASALLSSPSPLTASPTSSATTSTTTPSTSEEAPRKRYLVPEGFTEAAQAALDERIKDLPEAEREVEAKAFIAEVAATQQTLNLINAQRKQQEEGIKRRREKGQETLSDKVIRTFRF